LVRTAFGSATSQPVLEHAMMTRCQGAHSQATHVPRTTLRHAVSSSSDRILYRQAHVLSYSDACQALSSGKLTRLPHLVHMYPVASGFFWRKFLSIRHAASGKYRRCTKLFKKELGICDVTSQVHLGKSRLYFFFLDWVSHSSLFLSNISKPFLGSIRTTISRLLLHEGLVSFILRGAPR